ncbi:hypothetical protein [Fibrella aquatilis]|uniref:Uncharacterized protein n=1 Tax=Fibrella aquatilis TaxID=2817059 RepID=A0A939JYG2_9BACT|nr:hypothetical protein [Fibrella aquatilis]MBO0930338.1 hypothetical protein [Fibrella aquatilis]
MPYFLCIVLVVVIAVLVYFQHMTVHVVRHYTDENERLRADNDRLRGLVSTRIADLTSDDANAMMDILHQRPHA